MGKRKTRKYRSKPGKRLPKSKPVDSVRQITADELAKRERYFGFLVIAALLVFGIYQSVLYFGHKVVPISDFPDIVRVGHDLLHRWSGCCRLHFRTWSAGGIRI